MIGALLEVLAGGAVILGILALAWNIASAIETRRYLCSRGQSPRPFRLRIAFRRRKQLPSNVYRFPERNRAS